MKRLSLSLLALLLTLVMTKGNTTDYVSLSGKITNPTTSQLTILDGRKIQIKSITLNADGTFNDTIQRVNGTYMLFYGRGQRSFIYMKKGYNLHLTVDATQFAKTLKYSGKGAAPNNYLVQKYLLLEKDLTVDIFMLSRTLFTQKTDSLFSLFEQQLSKRKMGKRFVKNEKKDLAYQKAFVTIVYAIENKEEVDISAILEDINPTDEAEYERSIMCRRLALTIFYYEMLNGSKNRTEERAKIVKAIRKMPKSTFRDDIVNRLANIGLQSEVNEEEYALIMELCDNDLLKKELKKKRNTETSIAVGKPSPKFTNYENYNGGTTSLDDFKGKYVYIDVWATWCAPCRAEIPHLIALEKKYHGQNIVFVSLSVDKAKDREKWRKMIQDKGMGGVQLLADKNWNSDFVKSYLINGIPRFILIDPQGNIVKADAPRPSSVNEITALFDACGLKTK